MERHELERMNREELIGYATRSGVSQPRVLTQAELVDEIIARASADHRGSQPAKSRGWINRARDLLARVVEHGLHMPEAARALRSQSGDRQWPAPPPPMPTMTLAEIYAAQGHLDRAIAVLDEVVVREPEHGEARALRARYVEQLRSPSSRVRGEEGTGASNTGKPFVAPVPVSSKAAAAKAVSGVASQTSAPETHVSASAREVSTMANDSSELANVTPGSGNEVRAAAVDVPAKAGKPKQGTDSVGTTVDGGAGKVVPKVVGESTAGPAPAVADEVRAACPPSVSDAEKSSFDGAVGAKDPRTQPEDVGREDADPVITGEAVSAGEDLTALDEPTLPDRYEVDEIVAIAVDPRTVYMYWEVRATTLARARAQQPEGWLAIRVASVTASWEGPRIETRDLRVDALYGDRFLRDIQPGSNVRVSVGWRSQDGFEPFAVGAEVTAPRVVPVKTMSLDIARWDPTPSTPFQSRRVEPPAAPVSQEPSPPPAPIFEARYHGASTGAFGGPVDSSVESFGGSQSATHEGGNAAADLPLEAEEGYEIDEGEQLIEGSWCHPGGSSELGRGGPGRVRGARSARPGRPGRPVASAVLEGDVLPGVPEWSASWLGGASELSRGGASDLCRGGASDLVRR